MDQEINNNQEDHQIHSRHWFGFVSVLMLSIVIACGVVYYLMNQQFKDEKSDLAAQIESERQAKEMCEGEKEECEKKTTDINETVEQIDISNWKTCLNETGNYEFKYPSDWLIVDRYRQVLDSCYNPEDPRSSGFSIGPDSYQPENTFGINISTQEDLDKTIYKEASSLDEYYSKNKELLNSRMKIKELFIDGEKADLFQEKEGNKISVWFFHNKSLYEIRTDIPNINTLQSILSTLNFPN